MVQELEDLEKRGRVETTGEIGQNTEKSPEDLRRKCHSDSSGITSANAGLKNSQNNEKVIYLPKLLWKCLKMCPAGHSSQRI